ncbi:TldD/PmbA family protein [Piscinibacter sp. XHJ-5]|uniref:TldD/PmbA family protein n=1 Tax=Piscinibacter sp. XHJ-5 TaxID=3037797 RepID=UPI0024529BE1|nr:TldD/PmbA family protein [Piscinibacter sp. XHJ-5]
MNEASLQDTAQRALALMRAQGFDEAQVTVSRTRQDELNIAHNEPSLLRSIESQRLSLIGLVDARKASTELTDLGEAALREAVAALFSDAHGAPRDEANAVSSGQQARIVQGPQESDPALLADKVRELLAFRERETPKMMLEEGVASHTLATSHTLTSGGSELSSSIGIHEMSVLGTARDGRQSSSFNYAGGACHDLAERAASEWFGIAEMLRDTEQQIHTRPVGGKFVGEVVLTPMAVDDLLAWLLGQIGDVQLIAGTSLYRDRVGQAIASPMLSLRSRFDAPGVAALSADAFVTPPVEVLREGVLMTLTPSLYGSRKTGLRHVPIAAAGWEIAAGEASRSQLVSAVPRGALVGRLSMGMPASNGDFSGVIKNSFSIDGGVVGQALSETMISGNMAQMLRDVAGVSRERLDMGALVLPWIRISGLHFS